MAMQGVNQQLLKFSSDIKKNIRSYPPSCHRKRRCLRIAVFPTELRSQRGRDE